MATKAQQMKALLRDAEIFAVGTWNGLTFDESDLDGIVDAFHALNLAGRVPLKLGHDGDKPTEQRDDTIESQFALGWVKTLRRDGQVLKASMEVPDAVASAIDQEYLKNVSVELLPDVKAGTRAIPWVLDSVALLGADQPAVGVLKGLRSSLMKAAPTRMSRLGHGPRATFTRSVFTATQLENQPMTPEEEKRLKALEDSIVTFKADKTKADEALVAEQKARAKDKAEFRRKEILGMFDTAVKAQEILPKTLESFKRLYRVDDDVRVMEVTDADIKAFIEERKPVDEPELVKMKRASGAGGGAGTNAGGDKADADETGKTYMQVFTSRTEKTAVKMGFKQTDPNWAAGLSIAGERVMREDRHLARGYLDAPKDKYEPAKQDAA